MKPPCHHTRLVTGEHCHVEECSRGTVHVVLGDLTLRMRPAAFLATATALQRAAERLEGAGDRDTSATRLLC